MQVIKNKIDVLATTLSFICLVQCLLFPLLALVGIIFFDIFSHEVEHIVIICSIVLSILVTFHTYRVHKIYIPLIISIVSAITYIFNEISFDKHYIHILVSILIGICHISNYILSKNKCKHPHNCKK